MPLGNRADVTGFPAVTDGFLMLYGSAIQDTGTQAPIAPDLLTGSS